VSEEGPSYSSGLARSRSRLRAGQWLAALMTRHASAKQREEAVARVLGIGDAPPGNRLRSAQALLRMSITSSGWLSS